MPGTWAHFEGCLLSERAPQMVSSSATKEAEAGSQANVTIRLGETSANRIFGSRTAARRLVHSPSPVYAWSASAVYLRSRYVRLYAKTLSLSLLSV